MKRRIFILRGLFCMAEHLACRDGLWMLDYAKTVRWAVLWWEKE